MTQLGQGGYRFGCGRVRRSLGCSHVRELAFASTSASACRLQAPQSPQTDPRCHEVKARPFPPFSVLPPTRSPVHALTNTREICRGSGFAGNTNAIVQASSHLGGLCLETCSSTAAWTSSQASLHATKGTRSRVGLCSASCHGLRAHPDRAGSARPEHPPRRYQAPEPRS